MAIVGSSSAKVQAGRYFDPEHVGYASSVITLVTAFATAGATLYTAFAQPNVDVALYTAALLSFVLLVVIAFLAFVHSHKLRKIRRLSADVSSLTHSRDEAIKTCVVTAQNVNAIFSEFAEGLLDDSEHRTAHLGMYVNRTKAIFDRLSTSGQSAVCIKALKFDHGLSGFDGPYIWTAKRDDISSIDRSKVDHSPRLSRYAPHENKAFSDIMGRSSGKGFFASNNLQAMGSDYFNSNPNWRQFYNSAVVVPIKPCRDDVLLSTIGFLCVDSLCGTFTEEIAVAVLVLIAEILYLQIKEFTDLAEREPGSRPGVSHG